MPKNALPGKYYKTQDKDWGRCGFELNLYKAPKSKDHPLLLLKGGLGDAGSHSLRTVLDAILDITNGEMSVGTVGTVRPFNLYESLRIIFSSAEQSRARNQRMHSMRRASEKAVIQTGSRLVLLGGQSQGGVTAVDTATKLMEAKPKKNSPKIAVATIDTPGVYENLDYSGFPLKGLIDLGAHCLPTIAKLSNYEKYRLIKDNFTNPRIMLELPYLLGEVDYLKGIGIHKEIEALRLGGVAVGHIFHDQDIVEGAVNALDDNNAIVFPGTHITFMIEPEPVAEALVSMAYDIFDRPSNVIQLPQRANFFVPDSMVG